MKEYFARSKPVSWAMWFLLLASIIIAIWAWYPFLLYSTIEKSAGEYGDSYGALNTLFSGLAFAGVIYTIMIQSEELKLQRQEVRDTRIEIEGQRRALEAQSDTLKKQNFENALFSLIAMHQKVVDSFQVRTNENHYGKNAIRIIWKELKQQYDNERIANKNAKVIDYYRLYFERYQPYLSVYFRTLYRCFVYIEDNENLEIENFDIYSKALRAQLSDAETCLLYYNSCMTDAGFKFRDYIEKYALLDNFDPMTLLEPLNQINIVPEITEKAWGRSYKSLETEIKNKLAVK